MMFQLMRSEFLFACILFQGVLLQSPACQAASLIRRNTRDNLERQPGDEGANIIRVQVKVFVESLCIDSQRFFQNHLMPTYNLLGTAGIMDLQVVSFGNAHVTYDADTGEAVSVQCQHGNAECDANAYELCAADIYPITSRYLPFLSCLFNTLPMGHRDQPFDASIFADCANQSALPFAAIASCHMDNRRVLELQQKAEKATPDYHDHVPWVEVNGKFMDEELHDLQETVCKAYRAAGGMHPACTEILRLQ